MITALAEHRSFAALEPATTIIYELDQDLRIAYVNEAWRRFARRNGARTSLQDPIGLLALDAIAQPLRGFYEALFRRVLDYARHVELSYDCSSPVLYRRYHMLAYPKPDLRGIVVVHTLEEERPHAALAPEEHSPDPATYLGKGGFLTQCASCRRTRREDDRTRWDWVPAYVAKLDVQVSHGLCLDCLEALYPEEGGSLDELDQEPAPAVRPMQVRAA